jgi:hypothetical protein
MVNDFHAVREFEVAQAMHPGQQQVVILPPLAQRAQMRRPSGSELIARPADRQEEIRAEPNPPFVRSLPTRAASLLLLAWRRKSNRRNGSRPICRSYTSPMLLPADRVQSAARSS